MSGVHRPDEAVGTGSNFTTVPQIRENGWDHSELTILYDALVALKRGKTGVRLPSDWTGIAGKVADAFNDVVELNERMADELGEISQVVGKEGKLRQRAGMGAVTGFWRESLDNVNALIEDLVRPTAETARVIGAVARGDLSQKMALASDDRPLQGEFLRTAKTINKMVDQLGSFASEVTRVAREVGTEGKLGGQAKVPGAAGTWKGLTENVNQLAANLTTQVRAIAEVAMAVTKGDLTRSIAVEAQGEVAALKDTINEMIRNLRDTTRKNTEQDWLKTNLAKFSRMLQGQRDLTNVGHMILSELAPVVAAQQAEFYVPDIGQTPPVLRLLASYASEGQQALGKVLTFGEGLVGQCAIEKQKILLSNVPSTYVKISSDLGESPPQNILVLPIIFEGQIRGILELASFEAFNQTHHAFLDQLTESIGIVLNTIEANMRTEDLLKQSQSLAQELGSRQEELQNTNQELQDKARLLAHQNQEVERKNQEVEQARQALEDKAKQLALTSKYKSEFLANMSHELRTPLNSLLILSDQLCKNPDGNLTDRQMEFAKTIHSAGTELLMLINDILDLSKIESGTVVVEPAELRLDDLQLYVDRTFRHVAESKGVEFLTRFDPLLPKSMFTDTKRLQQILKNLLSNAFKFTHRGRVTFTVDLAHDGWRDNDELNRAPAVVAFSVTDTGIGIPADKQQIVFEAFQQADGSTSRKYGGTGLGLAISRELSRLLGGEISLTSIQSQGSTFRLFLPQVFNPARSLRRPLALAETPRERESDQAPTHVNGHSNGQSMLHTLEAVEEEEPENSINEIGDDRDDILLGDQVILVIENDLSFSRLLLEASHEQGLKAVATSRGAAGLILAREIKPHAITLDISLPDIDGWRVLERLKSDIGFRHIPVCVISTDESRDRALGSGAFAFVAKPIESKAHLDGVLVNLKKVIDSVGKNVIIAEPDVAKRAEMIERLTIHDINPIGVADTEEFASAMENRIDCIVLTPEFAEVPVEKLIETLHDRANFAPLPVVLIENLNSASSENGTWQRLKTHCTFSTARSRDRLIDQVTYFVHSNVNDLPDRERDVLLDLHQSDKLLSGKRVLIVDDDIRNIFALSALLEDHEMEIFSADNGRDAVQLLEGEQAVDVVLMDIMMPEMDGIDTIREIRKIPKLKDLPIIAVTAKAMKGDRERCIEAGAWDYLSKPVDTPRMLATLRAWLHR